MHTSVMSYVGEDGWAAMGACRHYDPDLFFPIAPRGPAAVQLAQAKQVCAHCPVQDHCLEYALETGQKFGVWGGASEEERRLIRGRRLQQRRPPPLRASGQ